MVKKIQYFFLSLTIDQNCQNIVIENKTYNNSYFIFLSTISLLAKFVKICSSQINFYVPVLHMWAKIVKIWSQYLNFLFYIVKNFVARWYYENLKINKFLSLKETFPFLGRFSNNQ